MYSYEIEEYLKKHNYRLNTLGLSFLMNTKLHPQINHIKYDSFNDTYDMWTSDGWHFHFKSISYSEFIQQTTQVIRDEVNYMNEDHYRLYISNDSAYKHILTSPQLIDLFVPMDQSILQDELTNARYLIIQHTNQTDIPLYLGFGNKLDYLKFKQESLDNMKGIKVYDKRREK